MLFLRRSKGELVMASATAGAMHRPLGMAGTIGSPMVQTLPQQLSGSNKVGDGFKCAATLLNLSYYARLFSFNN